MAGEHSGAFSMLKARYCSRELRVLKINAISFALADLSGTPPVHRFPFFLVCDGPITTIYIIWGRDFRPNAYVVNMDRK